MRLKVFSYGPQIPQLQLATVDPMMHESTEGLYNTSRTHGKTTQTSHLGEILSSASKQASVFPVGPEQDKVTLWTQIKINNDLI